jgi:hypothetical protein
MIGLAAGTRIWIAAGVTDLRRGFTGLSGMVQTTVPTEYSVQPMGDVPTGPQSLSSLRPNLSLANEICRCPRMQGSKGAQFGHKFQRTKERQRVGWWNRAFLGNPAFVAVVQATDLR